MSPLTLVTGGRIATRIIALTPPMKTFLQLKIWQLPSRYVAMATNFVTRVGDKLAFNVFVVCAGIIQ